MYDQGNTELRTAAARRGTFDAWRIARLVMAVSLLMLVVVRLLGSTTDPPFPLNDPAFANLFTLIFAFIAVFTAWLWFSFYSGYSLGAKRTVMVAPVVIAAAALGTVWAVGFNRLFELDGSMGLRLAPLTKEPGRFEAALNTSQIDMTTTTPQDFPQFLGPDRSCWISGSHLATDWETNPPKLKWKRPIGPGWSAFAAVNGYAVTMEQRDNEEWVTCYEISTGKPIWGHSIEGRHENPMGGIGPRGTPTIHQGRVYALGATCVLHCLEGSNGKLIWSDDLRQRYGLDAYQDEINVQWGRAASPLIVDNLVIVPGGGPPGKAKNLVAFNNATGRLVWEAENLTEAGTPDQISYASPSLATLALRRQILIVNESTASGHDSANGDRLWSFPWPGYSSGNASSSQAVAIDGNHVLLSKGYSGGSELIEIKSSTDGTFTATSAWKSPRLLQTKFTNLVVRDSHAYGLSEGILECVEVMKGQRKWKSGRYGHGQILGVGDVLLVLSEEGELSLVELNPQKFVSLGSFPALEGKTWNNLCLYGNHLLIRNAQEAACCELP